ncbi:MAG: hypothetical protein V1743_05485 [Nanoarchaeota archaeon]
MKKRSAHTAAHAQARKHHDQKEGPFTKFLRVVGKAGSYLIGEGIDIVKRKMDEEIEEMQRRIELTIKQVLKRITLVIILFTGALFILAGLGKYLSETVPSLDHGLGYVFIGGLLVVLAVLVKLFTIE